MKGFALAVFILTLLVLVQPVALSNTGFTWVEGAEVCGIIGVILIVVVLIIGLFFVFESKNKKNIQTQQEQSVYCTNCGKAVALGSNVCPYCGQNLIVKNK